MSNKTSRKITEDHLNLNFLKEPVFIKPRQVSAEKQVTLPPKDEDDGMPEFKDIISYTHGFSKYIDLTLKKKDTKYEINMQDGLFVYIFVLSGEITVDSSATPADSQSPPGDTERKFGKFETLRFRVYDDDEVLKFKSSGDDTRVMMFLLMSSHQSENLKDKIEAQRPYMSHPEASVFR